MNIKIIRNVGFLLILLFSFGCSGIYENGYELANEVNKQIPQISVDSLKAKLDRGDDFYLIDVRQPEEYLNGNIDAATLIPRGELEFIITNSKYWEDQYMYTPEKQSEIVVYSQKGFRGALAAKQLMLIGYKNVKNLTGGFDSFDPTHEATPAHHEEGGCGG